MKKRWRTPSPSPAEAVSGRSATHPGRGEFDSVHSVLGGISGVALVILRDVPAASAVTSQLAEVAPELGYAVVAVLASLGALQLNHLLFASEP
ncbi:MAG: hypothetical protein ACRD2X_05285 [Vicinamibacteraceae bacterium]